MSKIKVLWIDDQPNDAFIDDAFDLDIRIDVRRNYDDGVTALQSTCAYDAIILDANCLCHNDSSEIPDISALGYGIKSIKAAGINLPWFVYSLGGFSGDIAIDVIVKGYQDERPYDQVLWYKKPAQEQELFDKIKEVVSNRNEYQLKQRYSAEFAAAKSVKDAERLLLEGLLFEYQNSPKSIQDYFNPIRKIAENIVSQCQSLGYIPSNMTLNGIAKLLYSDPGSEVEGVSLQKRIMTRALGHSFIYFLDITQDASHDKLDLPLGITDYVRDRKNTNLFKSVLYIVMDLLLWFDELKRTDVDSRNIQIHYKYTGTVIMKEINGRSFYYVDKCQLQWQEGLTVGITVNVLKTIPNSHSFDNVVEFASKNNYILL